MHAPRGVWWRLVAFGFRLLYRELAFTYDLVSKVVSFGQWRSWQRTAIAHLPADPASPVLEIAHGTGDLQRDLHAAGILSVGLDISPQMGRIARRKLRRHDVPVRLVRGSALQLPFPAGAFDAIVSTFPTPFIIHPDTLHELHRVLVPGGRVVVVLTGLLTTRNLLTGVVEWLYRITGQRQPFPGSTLQQVAAAGFDYTIIEDELPRSTVTVLVATARSSDSSSAMHS